MKLKLKQKSYSALFFIALNLLKAAIPLLMLPIFMSYFSATTIGLLGIFNIGYTLLQNVIGLGSLTQIQKEVILLDKSEFIVKFLHGIITAILVSLTICAIIYLFLGEILHSILSLNNQIQFLTVLSAILFFIGDRYLLILQQQKRLYYYAIIVLVSTALNFFISWILISDGYGLIGRVLGIFSGEMIIFLVLLLRHFDIGILHSLISMNFSEYFRNLSREIGFLPFLVGNWGSKNLQKIAVLGFSNIEVFGLYTIGSSLSRIVSLPLSSIIQGVKPYLNEDLSIRQHKNVFRTELFLGIGGILIVCGGLIFSDFYLRFINASSGYKELFTILIPIFMLAYVDSLLLYYRSILVYLGFKKYLTAQTLISVSLIGVFVFYSVNSIYMFLYALLVSNFCLVLVTGVYIRKRI